jgi:hypothetical protein
MRILEITAAAVLAIGAVYVVSVIYLAFFYHTLKIFGL